MRQSWGILNMVLKISLPSLDSMPYLFHKISKIIKITFPNFE